MYTALLFDLDNTLIDRDAAVKAYYRERLSGMSPSKISLLDELLSRDMSGRGDRGEFMKWYQRNFAPDSTHRELIIEMRFGITTKIRAFSGVKTMLTLLGKTHTLGLLTNGSGEGQRLKLEAAGLARYFDSRHIFISEELYAEKPDPKAFEMALGRIGGEPSSTLMIGDDHLNDIAGAAALGMDTCWVSHGKPYPGEQRPIYTIEKTSGLAEILKP
jgi:putative hydrolase of the HAD superfamily